MIAKNCVIKSVIFFCVAVIGFQMIQANGSQAAYIVDPVAYWRLEEAVAPYLDHVGINDGTCTSCPTVDNTDGIVENYQIFDGVSNGIRVSEGGVFDWGPDDSFSIEFWIKRDFPGVTDIRDQNELMIGRDEGVAAGFHWWVGLRGADDANEGKVIFSLNDADDAISVPWVTSDSSVADNQWHHIVVVRDDVAGENLMYVDGVLQQDIEVVDYDAGFDSPDETVEIGFIDLNIDANPVPGYFFNGRLDELAVYNVALTAAQIQQIYQKGAEGKWLDSDDDDGDDDDKNGGGGGGGGGGGSCFVDTLK